MFASFATALLASTLQAADFQAASATATNYAGGWSTTNPTSECVDICSAPSKTCLTSDAACLAKTEAPSDFDYLVLEQLFVPQFCRDLLKGYDSTISHQNVDVCCNPNSTVTNQPYDAAEFALLESDLLATMGEKWVDATQATTYESLCEIYNHEFQKHGLCYAANGDDYISAAVTYFEATLNTADRISSATEQINAWAAQSTPQTTLAEIEALYDHDVIVLCSSVDGNNTLSSIRTCYEKPTNITSDGPTTQTDCATITASSPFKFCSGDYPIQLTAYTAPDSSASTMSAPTATATAAPATTAPATPCRHHCGPDVVSVPAARAAHAALLSALQPGFCGLLWFCEWSSDTKKCNGRNFF
ncbi:unnamed protein product [Phytophthora lilii]|uniref:Unnamed protein product n=1 Tax=Phytophthora lilii TaxID=2077276 RepID=A0A9W6TCU4_9STRA|nr:unnamed protein product [Phytophthora lilii]